MIRHPTMNILRVSGQALRHHLCLRSQRSNRWTSNFHQIAGSGRRRRSFSDFSNQSPRFRAASNERDLEKFTNFALNSRVVPLGSMSNDLWEETILVINSWLQLGGGFGLDSASRLLRRLYVEHTILNPMNTKFKTKLKSIVDLHRLLLQSCLDARSNHQNSKLALLKVDDALRRLIACQSNDVKSFPINETLFVVESWINVDTHEGIENAARLLLFVTDHTTDFEAHLSPYMEATRMKLVESKRNNLNDTEINEVFSKRMKDLKESEGWQTNELPEPSWKEMAAESLAQEQKEVEELGVSKFDLDILQKRAVKVITNAGEGDQNAIEILLTKLYETNNENPTGEIIASLVDFYVRINDAGQALQWMQRIDQTTALHVNLTDLLENVLDVYSQDNTQESTRGAEDLFQHVIDLQQYTVNSHITAQSFNRLFKQLIKSKEQDSSRKVRGWFLRMVESDVRPDATSFKILFTALETNHNNGQIEKMMNLLLEHWTDFSKIEKRHLVEHTIKLTVCRGSFIPAVYQVLDLLKEDNIQLPESTFKTALQDINTDTIDPRFIMDFMKAFEGFESGINFPLYQSIMQALLKFEKKALTETSLVYSQVLDKMQKNPDDITNKSFGEFLFSVLAMYTYRNLYNQAEECLRRAEKVVLTKTSKEDATSMIPLECYQRMIKRKWYTKTTAPWAESNFQRLMDFYQSGYSNLRPNQDIFSAYIRARATTASNAKQVEQVLDEMLDLYEATDDKSCKPNAEIFNTVLLAYKQDNQKTTVSGQKSISLLENMQKLEIRPSTKSLNFVMHNINRSTKKDVYRKVHNVFQKFDDYNLEPDTFSRHYMLDACSSAGPKNRDGALKSALGTFGDIRQENQVGPVTYKILTKVLLRLLSQDSRADKVATSVFLLCCEDGYLEKSQVKKRFKSLLSHKAWNELYLSKKKEENLEPSEWSRNVT